MSAAPFTFSQIRAQLSGGASALQITERTLGAIDEQNGALRAFVALDRERALADARHIDALRKIGAPLGPLAGIPLGIKDVIDVAGLQTRAGSLTRADTPPAPRDAPCVARLRAAGAIIVGKTHTVEYAFGGWGTNVTIGTPLNPRDRAHPRTPGGSSSGSGVAVAAGLVPAALGSDTGGSVRLPASFCGCVGLKTTIGLIDIDCAVALAPIFDTIGPLTNCVADAAALLCALAPAQDAHSACWSERIEAIAQGRGPAIGGLRVGVVAGARGVLHPETEQGLAQTVARLRKLGAQVETVALEESPTDLAAPLGEIMAVEAYRMHGRFAEETPSRLGAPVRARMLAGRDTPAHRMNAILKHREEAKLRIRQLFRRFDALLTPATPFPAPLLSEYDENTSPGLFTRFVNYLDLSALVLPMGATPQGLPIGMQIVAPGLGEPLALEIGAALEADRGALALS